MMVGIRISAFFTCQDKENRELSEGMEELLWKVFNNPLTIYKI